ncbi:MAG: hypothetical protein AAB486_05110 [Patescibacteria group bacterium]
MGSKINNPTFFHSNLIIGGTDRKRRETASSLAKKEMGEGIKIIPGVDFLELETPEDKTTISIEEIRNLQSRLSLRPYQSKVKAAIIYEAQKASPEAQNCLLKTLEEPPRHSLIILTAPEKDSLLPTIVSRCRLIDLGGRGKEGTGNTLASLETILKMSKGERLSFVDNNKTELNERETAIEHIDSWLSEAHQGLVAEPENATYLKVGKECLVMKETLATVNVNVRLALETLLITLPYRHCEPRIRR